ncbi:hypothetical protein PsorP6_007814 [Peronosclerospora sorghi]|uniref:Uncharacterized protein n=1 Tax=Peronosclerospora sorghi TaxID=230839 RepID=A0ACC0WAC4_9STRA|nr:hypothetical protein PsorP6_007814 [Peronosclerospora sorghi]
MQQHQDKSQAHLQRQQQQFLMKQQEIVDQKLEQRKKYCQYQNIDMYDPSYFNYAISLITVNLTGYAAARHQDFEQQGKEVHSIEELNEVMTSEFLPVDLQEILREKMDALKQKHCRNLDEYIMKFRKLVSDIKEMSDLD